MSEILSMYHGTNVSNLPTPSFVIKQDKFEENCKIMFDNVEQLSQITGKQIKFRPHVKTHKTAKGSFKQLGHGLISKPYDSILISTIKEAQGLLDYQTQSGKSYIKDVAFSLPACIPEYLIQLRDLSKRVEHLRIFVDHPTHLDNLVKFGKPTNDRKWSVFLKIDMGTHRAGVVTGSEDFHTMVQRLTSDPAVTECVEFYGIYAHAGHSYGSGNILEAHQLLLNEIKAVNDTAKRVQEVVSGFNVSKLILSVGATPTTNSLRIRDEPQLIDLVQNKLVATLEIHCGNYCLYDLQQVSTGCVSINEVSGYILGSIVSSYKDRRELLTNTGVMATARELSKIEGRGLCISLDKLSAKESYDVKWYLDRVSQEHGIMKPYGEKNNDTELLPIGSKFAVIPQHACIAMGQFPYYFVLDNNDNVLDVWIPYQKW